MLALVDAWTRLSTHRHRLCPSSPDLVPLNLIPSVAAGDMRNRVLAEIDQNGNVFAEQEIDQQFFGIGGPREPRSAHQLQIVLVDRALRLRKTALKPAGDSRRARMRWLLRWDLALETAALLRLHDCKSVPRVRRVDWWKGAVELDYIWGRDLRQYAAVSGSPSPAITAKDPFSNSARTDLPMLEAWLRELAGQLLLRGVVHLDLHPGNILQGACTGALYLIDFNFVYLRPSPGWKRDARSFATTCGIDDHATRAL